MIYLDNNATTAPAPEVVEAMRPWWTDRFGNAGSAHAAGAAARAAMDEARDALAARLGARSDEVVFTSGGTEANNAALVGAVLAAREGRRRVVVSAVEHSSVIGLAGPTGPLARIAGAEVSILPVDPAGRPDLDALSRLTDDHTAVVSVMSVNNETGAVMPIEEIGRLVRARGARLHVDAVQAVGKVPIRFADLPADLLTVSAHKLHGPQGVGAVLIRKGTPWQPLIVGGPQERNRRGGTENVAGIVGFAEAMRLADAFMSAGGPARIAALRDRLEAAIVRTIPGTVVTAGAGPRVCNTTNIRFAGCRGEALLMALDKAGVCVSVGSACSSGSLRPSHVLTAMGIGEADARSAVRFSLSRYTTADEVDAAIRHVQAAVERLRAAPADDLPALL